MRAKLLARRVAAATFAASLVACLIPLPIGGKKDAGAENAQQSAPGASASAATASAPTAVATASANTKATTTASAVAAKPAAAKPKPASAAADAPCPGPGLTRRCNGRCVNIQTDDRNCGSCGTVCPPGKRCDGHMFCRDSAGNL